ncbi:hypothetical protein GO988_15440 [Hymenobacter sp. HMF4947]|uniref:Uncharacterized protein n=1 Tax=Hymenobacter ginkgonis TaxID=2682976 RepID=A0A7K1THF4_9BACT|nr:hypothetical protein [Hymenobacter ginkgonis]MVN77726.1 hypothetical protein [Hymenobacter ginkgonis]
MLPLPYTLRSAYSRLAQFLKTLRAQMPLVVRTRTVRGKTEQYLVRPKALSDGAQATARVLLVWAIDAVEQLRRVPLLLEPATDARPTPPPVATNNEQLAAFRQVSSRAIRDHLRELQKIGFIARKVFRGTKANFEVYLNAEFVWKTANKTSNSPFKPKNAQAAPAAPAPASATNLPLIVSLEKQDNKEIEIAQVDKLVTPEATGGAGALTGNTGPQAGAKPAPTPPVAPRQATKAGQGGRAAPLAPAGGTAAAAQLQAERLALTAQAWHYAWKRLYPSCAFDETEQQKAMRAIWYGVYRGFGPVLTPEQWQRYHDQVLQRIDLAAAYFQRYPNKFAPSPFAEFVTGSGYFDAENSRGFVGTEAWLARQEANQRQRNITRALLTARRALKAHRLGLAPKRTQVLSSLQLFRYHEAKLKAYGPDALQRYYAQVAQPGVPSPHRIAFTAIATT